MKGEVVLSVVASTAKNTKLLANFWKIALLINYSAEEINYRWTILQLKFLKIIVGRFSDL